jgi:excinuclease ABC subunit C
VRKLLAGESAALVADLTKKMNEEAAALRFEEAAKMRNAVQAIVEISEPRSVEDRDIEDRDYIAWAAEGVFTAFSVFSMRGGRMIGRDLFCSRSAAEEEETLETFITSYYSPDRPPPPKIFLQLKGETPAALAQFFTEEFGYVPGIFPPDEKRHEAALAMARQNALEELRRRLRERGAGPALDELKSVLNLKTRPERIEGFDIAQLDGKHPVASLVSFKNGVPDKKNYRYFKLRSVIGVVDDFAAMREAVHRRYSRLLKEGKELPDLVLIDGGIGQVNAALAVINELGIDCGLAGLAKKEEEIWLPGAKEALRLSRRSEALKTLQFVRDETHRFATGLNQKLRSKDLFFPVLESIDGIGPKRAAAIMKAYGSLEKIAAAKIEELAENCRLSEAASRAVRAAAKLAVQDSAAKKEKLSATRGKRFSNSLASGKADASASNAASLAAFAAEDTPEYGGEE